MEAACGLVSRAFASGEANPLLTVATQAVTPQILALLGRQLVVRGEALLLIDVDVEAGIVSLRPASAWDVIGGSDPASWRYRIDLAGPSRTTTVSRPAEAVAHVRVNADPGTPWKGQSPLARAGLTAALAAQLEKGLTAEARTPVRPHRAVAVP